ncbi:MAG: ribonuclease HII [Candidatus Moraniibacteriota bacterium]|nr:MAG: ribonuclease HII [Candidatus Moranbacteria bacterium]
MQLPTFEYEKRLTGQGLIPIGIDEAGRGPLAGPVVAAAVLLKNFESRISNLEKEENEKLWKLVRDSKKLSEKQREQAYLFVRDQFHIGVGIISAETIDRVNILQATFLAMRSAISELRRILNQELGIKGEEKLVLLIDGNQKIPNTSLAQEAIVDGDGLVKSIAAASIIAKVTRDRLIILADHEYPAYGFARHKGYGTREHMEALRKYGPTPIHRKSFRPVQLANPETVNQRFSRDLQPKKRPSIAKKRPI